MPEVKVNKSDKFLKKEEKYKNKLSNRQIADYDDRIKKFKGSTPPSHNQLDTHALSWDLKWFFSFTCCKLDWRNDRIIFTIDKGKSISFYDIEEVTFEEIGDHGAYEALKRR